jgi:hypothetical protein
LKIEELSRISTLNEFCTFIRKLSPLSETFVLKQPVIDTMSHCTFPTARTEANETRVVGHFKMQSVFRLYRRIVGRLISNESELEGNRYRGLVKVFS